MRGTSRCQGALLVGRRLGFGLGLNRYGTEEPLAFDFGFTVSRRLTPTDKAWALAFSLFQMVEHCPRAVLDRLPLFHVATALLRDGTFAPLPALRLAKGMPLRELARFRTP